MQLARRHDIGNEVLQAAAFALFVGFVYHYFGPLATTPPSPEVFGILTICVLLFVATVNRPRRAQAPNNAAGETLSRQQLRQLREKLHGADWRQLDEVVSGIYSMLGCATSPHSNLEGEHSFSLVIERAGQKTAVMCKPWKNTEVTSPEIIEFSTELKRAGLSCGVFVTLRDCTAPALKVAETLRIDVVGQDGLLQLLAATDESHRAELLAKLGEEPKLCPTCDQRMILRTATKGLGAGEQFWECSDYPQCRCTEPH
jgi:restriction system protein